MPRLYNTDHQTAVLSWVEGIVVQPGEPHDFTDEELAVGLAGSWSEQDPRAGLKAEQQFKKRRDRKASQPPSNEPDAEGEPTDPAEPEKE